MCSKDYRIKESEECLLKTIPNRCTRIHMVTDYQVVCPYGDDSFNGYFEGQDLQYPGCPDAPWWFHMRHFFRITGYYDLEGIDENGYPKFTKLAHNIKISYNREAQSWVVNNDQSGKAEFNEYKLQK